MEEWSNPLQRIAVWLVAAFAGLASVLLASIQLGSFDWGKAEHPLLAVVALALAVAASVAVVLLAAQVLKPQRTLFSLRTRQLSAERRARKHPGQGVTWNQIAAEDWLLAKIHTHDQFSSSPEDVAQEAGEDGATDAAKTRARQMAESAEFWLARRRLTQLQWVIPLAVLVVLIGTIAWVSFSKPAARSASAEKPVSVLVSLRPNVRPAAIAGPDCTKRVLSGVAISGDVRTSAIIAFPPQDDCASGISVIDPSIATISQAGG